MEIINIFSFQGLLFYICFSPFFAPCLFVNCATFHPYKVTTAKTICESAKKRKRKMESPCNDLFRTFQHFHPSLARECDAFPFNNPNYFFSPSIPDINLRLCGDVDLCAFTKMKRRFSRMLLASFGEEARLLQAMGDWIVGFFSCVQRRVTFPIFPFIHFCQVHLPSSGREQASAP